MKITDIRNISAERFKLQKEYGKGDHPSGNKKPMVSVIVCTYQHAPFIADCLESIIRQKTDFPFEIVIGEDGSRDGTREICMEFAEKYPELIRLFLRDRRLSQLFDRRGRFVRLLNGIWTRDSGRGKYIAFCEGDDYWIDPQKLQKQTEFMESHADAVMVAHRAYIVDVDRNILSIFPEKQPVYLKNSRLIFRGGGFFATNGIFLRKSMTGNLPDWYYTVSAGDTAMMNLAIHRGRIGFINEIMSAYRIGVRDSWTQKKMGNPKTQIVHLIDQNKSYTRMLWAKPQYAVFYLNKIFFLNYRIFCFLSIVLRQFFRNIFKSQSPH